MCGICGISNYGNDAPVDESTLRRMTAAMTHRGPDDDGFHVDGSTALGMRRLSIIDLAGGAQPVTNEDGTIWVVSNGEIYNFRELRRELEARRHVFRTRSDTEVIVHAYEEWGIEAFARLNGMFGAAVWDASERQLVLARDPYGIKPLYCWHDASTLAFASELRSLFCHPRIRRAVDVRGLHQFLGLTFVPSPRTAFEGVTKVIPGHLVVCNRKGVRVERFHRQPPEPLEEAEDALVERLRHELALAVERQMISDVPIGVMLSGGTDSTAVAGIMSRAGDERLETFTVGFDGRFAMNELEPARQTARRLGASHHEVLITGAEFSDFMPTAIRHLEEPIATTSALAFYKVCELAREHVKVVLTGQGADEPFAGYPRHLGERYGGAYRALPGPLRRGIIAPLIAALPRNEQLKRAVSSLATDDEIARLARVYTVLDDGLRRELSAGDAADEELTAAIERWHGDAAKLDPLGKMLYVDARLPLADNLLIYADKMSMAVSLEARVPFLDLELMKLAESIPARFKIRGRRQKAILKEAIAEWVPRDVVRRKKVGFATPVDEWLRGEMGASLRERLLDRDSACSTYLRADAIDRMTREHETGRHDHKRILFSLLTFEIWHEQFIAPSTWAAAPIDRGTVASA
jgi:asparagine synthase (glutamine-hydrolysing)